jgi:oxygen-independent coproporphyrinogen-3 oxidase
LSQAAKTTPKQTGFSGVTGDESYFVSNYPPYPTWSSDHVEGLRATLTESPQDDRPLGVYLHIPFCRKRCHFCYFKVYTGQNSKQVDSYIDGLLREAKAVANLAGWSDRNPEFLYMGGGTPSFLSARQLGRLFTGLSEVLSVQDLKEFTFECEPGTISVDKIKALKDIGVDRLSLGVEHFDDTVLSINGRAHDQASVYEAYDYARTVDLPQINVDLIAGMLGDSEEGWLDTVRRTIALQPDSVTIYQMELPFNTTFQDEIRHEHQTASHFVDWPTKRRWLTVAFAMLDEAGYRSSSGYTMIRSESSSFVYRDALWHGADMMGLGVSAFSHFRGNHYQNEKDLGRYLERVGEDQAPIWRAYVTTTEEQMIREWILQLKTGRVQRSYFQTKFQVDVVDQFRAELDDLCEQDLCVLSDSEIRLTRAGLIQVDRLLSRFFLPPHRR